MILFAYELITSTQARILLASYPDTSFVAIVSLFTAIFELGVRLFNLFKVRSDLAELEAVGLDEKNRQLFMRKARIYAVVSTDMERQEDRIAWKDKGRKRKWATRC